MKIVNHTNYQTRHLRAFVTRIARTEVPNADKRGRIRVVFDPTTHWSAHGYARLHSMGICVCLSSNPAAIDRIWLCAVIAHELHHLETGKSGRAIEYSWRRSVPYGRPRTASGREAQRDLYAWALDLPLEVKPPKPVRAKLPVIDVRRQRAEALLAKWQAALLRAQRFVRKYERRVTYYNRREQARVAASGKNS